MIIDLCCKSVVVIPKFYVTTLAVCLQPPLNEEQGVFTDPDGARIPGEEKNEFDAPNTQCFVLNRPERLFVDHTLHYHYRIKTTHVENPSEVVDWYIQLIEDKDWWVLVHTGDFRTMLHLGDYKPGWVGLDPNHERYPTAWDRLGSLDI